MRYLIVARHGFANEDELTGLGQAVIERLAEQLKARLSGASVFILSSTAGRARQSAELIASIIPAEIKLFEELFSEPGRRYDLNRILELVNEHKDQADAILLITHYEICEWFPKHFTKHNWRKSCHSTAIDSGKAWFMDCEAETREQIPPPRKPE